MNKIIRLAMVICFLLAGTVYAQGKKYALLIGVEKYDPAQFSTLQYPEDDAIALGKELEQLGFSVIVMTASSPVPDHEPDTALDILNQLDRRLRDRNPEDTVIVSLSGHGVQLKNDPVDVKTGAKESYFCPKRANLTNRSSLLAMSEVMQRMSACNAGRKLLLVDACRNEVESKDFATRGKSPVEIELDPAGVTRRTIPDGMLALFSCSPKERAFEESRLGHSVFANHLLRYLRGEANPVRYPKQQISVSELATFVSRETRDYIEERLGKDQTPELIFPGRRIQDWSLGDLVESLLTNSIGMDLKLLPAGEFLMGSPASEEGHGDDEYQHRVRLTQSFYLQTTEVTQGQWKSVMGTEPWKGQDYVKEGDDYAATHVNYDDAVTFCRKLSAREGGTYRLPTEAEWEYACRGGTSTMYSFGASAGQLGDYGWFDENAWDVDEKYAHRVGQKRSNGFGLYDMHGNVYEWCSDWYDGDYYKSSPVVDPGGASSGSDRVLRGGSWASTAGSCRSANRLRLSPSLRSLSLGFRVARSSVK